MTGRIAATRLGSATLLAVGLLLGVLSLAPWFTPSASAAPSATAVAASAVAVFTMTSTGAVGSNPSATKATATGTYWKGADGRLYISGQVCDRAQDGQPARLQIVFGKAWARDGRTETVQANGGSGTCTSFNFNSQYTYADLTLGTVAAAGRVTFFTNLVTRRVSTP